MLRWMISSVRGEREPRAALEASRVPRPDAPSVQSCQEEPFLIAPINFGREHLLRLHWARRRRRHCRSQSLISSHAGGARPLEAAAAARVPINLKQNPLPGARHTKRAPARD
jgi:hypothetical protein